VTSLIALAACIFFLMETQEIRIARTSQDWLHLTIGNNCTIRFSAYDPAIPDAYTLNASEWKTLSNKCHGTWKNELQELKTMELLHVDLTLAKDFLGKSNNTVQQHLKLFLLLSFNRSQMPKMARFCLSLETKNLRVQCFTHVHQRMTIFKKRLLVDTLTFWFYAMNSGFNTSIENAEVDEIVSQLNDQMQRGFPRTGAQFQAFYKLGESTKKHYLPKMISKYDETGYPWNKFIVFIDANMRDATCLAYKKLMQWFQNKTIKETSALLSLLNFTQLNYNPQANESTKLCLEVENELRNELTSANLKKILKQFDGKKYQSLRKNELTVVLVPALIRARFNVTSLMELINFLWGDQHEVWSDAAQNIACVGSQALAEQLQTSRQQDTIQALSLFSHCLGYAQESVCEISIANAIAHAPTYVRYFMFLQGTCDDVSCAEEIFDALVTVMQDNATDMINEFQREVLFVWYVLSAINMESNVSLEVFNVHFEAMVSFYMQNTNENIVFDIFRLRSWNHEKIYDHYLRLVVREASLRNGSHYQTVFRHISIFKKNFSSVCHSLDTILIPEIVNSNELNLFVQAMCGWASRAFLVL
jgi:hypothetical protein